MRKYLLCLLTALICVKICARGLDKYENSLTVESLQRTVASLTDDLTEGRETGRSGNLIAREFLVKSFRDMGLVPYRWHYTESFRCNDTTIGRNVIGILPSLKPSDEYVVVSAHYDHMGKLGGRIYPGADDNASGVAALVALAQMFCRMRADGAGPDKNLIFAAFDAKELDMKGSGHFVKNLHLAAGKVVCNVNMDILGSSLVPPGKNNKYLLALGEETLPERYKGYLSFLCGFKRNLQMDLCLSFYGSRDFTKMMYKLGDHNSFAEAGIPAVFFTSGFHRHTYKPTDTIDIIDFELLRKRTMVIFEFVNHLCAE